VSMYEKSKNADYEQPPNHPDGVSKIQPIDFQFPDPKSVYNKK